MSSSDCVTWFYKHTFSCTHSSKNDSLAKWWIWVIILLQLPLTGIPFVLNITLSIYKFGAKITTLGKRYPYIRYKFLHWNCIFHRFLNKSVKAISVLAIQVPSLCHLELPLCKHSVWHWNAQQLNMLFLIRLSNSAEERVQLFFFFYWILK